MESRVCRVALSATLRPEGAAENSPGRQAWVSDAPNPSEPQRGDTCPRCVAPLGLRGECLLLLSKFRDADVAEEDVGGGVVALQGDRPPGGPVAVAGVVVLLALVGPVHLLVAVDPRGEVLAVGGNRHRDPLVVVGDD